MARHKRLKTLPSLEMTATLAALERLHNHLKFDLVNLVPTEPQYRALERVSLEICAAIKVLTGEDPLWQQHALALSLQPNMVRRPG